MSSHNLETRIDCSVRKRSLSRSGGIKFCRTRSHLPRTLLCTFYSFNEIVLFLYSCKSFNTYFTFQALFINAALFPVCLLVFQLALVVIQFVLLLKSNEWYQMISLSLLQASGGYALFKLTRDSVVVWRLSLAEEMLKNA